MCHKSRWPTALTARMAPARRHEKRLVCPCFRTHSRVAPVSRFRWSVTHPAATHRSSHGRWLCSSPPCPDSCCLNEKLLYGMRKLRLRLATVSCCLGLYSHLSWFARGPFL